MIVRSKLHWLHMLFVVRGSILYKIAPQLLATTIFAALVTILHGSIFSWKVSLNFVPFSLMGLTLAIFLSFRNNTAYARYWEARTLWGSVLKDSRTLTRQALTLGTDKSQAPELVYLLCAFVHSLKNQLRSQDLSRDLARFLSPHQCARVEKARFPASIVLLMVNEWLGDQLKQGRLNPVIVPAFERPLAQLSTALGGCERIANTPIPFTYSIIIHRCVYLYCFWLPFGLLDTIGVMTPVIVGFIAYTFFALEALGAEIEDPFGTDPNDLALSAMSYNIESSILEMIEEQPRSEAPKIKNYILN